MISSPDKSGSAVGLRRIAPALLLLVSLFGLSLLMGGCGGEGTSDDRKADAGSSESVYERFILRNVYNKRYQWSDFLGKPFMINFWATWCGPCRREMPILQSLYKEYHPRGLEIVAISLDDERTAMNIISFIDHYQVPWVVLHSDVRDLALVGREFGLTGSIPTTIFFDARGNETGRIIGAQPESVFRRELGRLFPASPQM